MGIYPCANRKFACASIFRDYDLSTTEDVFVELKNELIYSFKDIQKDLGYCQTFTKPILIILPFLLSIVYTLARELFRHFVIQIFDRIFLK